MFLNNNIYIKNLIFLSIFFSVFFLSGCLTGGVFVQAETKGNKKSIKNDKKDAPIKKVAQHTYKIGNVIIDFKNKEVRVPGVVNMNLGMIEYLAVSKRGKDHESILVLDAEPVNIHAGLLLLNINPGKQPNKNGELSGDLVKLFVSWKENNKEKRLRAEALIFNQQKKVPMRNTKWIFNGSVIEGKRFMAQEEKSIVATFYDPFALINNPLPTSQDDTVYEVNVMCVPKEETPIILIIRKS
jgi:hypothetical protein